MANPLVTHPPYLRYDVPSDLVKIQAAIKALSDAAKKQRWKLEVTQASASTFTGLDLQNDVTVATVTTKVAEERVAAAPSRFASAAHLSSAGFSHGTTQFSASRVTAQAQAAVAAATAAAAPSAAPAQIATFPVNVTPSGMVPLGFNCRKEFQATTEWPSNQVTHLVWNLLLMNKQTGVYDKIFFMDGTTVGMATDPVPANIKFEHDFSTYRDSAYTSSDKTAIFKVQCRYYVYFDEVAVTQSLPITLDFSVQSCLGIHSLALSTDSVTGDDNGTEPTLTVTLDGPAGPGGQKVLLSTDNSNLGWIHGSKSFVIGAGQTSDSISWFLGTKQVLVTGRSFNIIAKLDSPGGKSGPAYAKMHLTKKKKKK